MCKLSSRPKQNNWFLSEGSKLIYDLWTCQASAHNKNKPFDNIFLNFQLEIVGLNRENYETRRRVVYMSVQEKPGENIIFCLLYYFPPMNMEQTL